MDIQTEFEAFLWLCGLVTAIGGAIGIICRAYVAIKKPTNEIQKEVTKQQKRIERLEDGNSELLKELKRARKLQTANSRSTLAIMDHLISGNHVDNLKAERRSLQTSITDVDGE